ncbi:MAG: TonB-dependent receptor [Gemmatimonadetes bacterium]|nr:TonB-dependent receptor [Gemmatimonadota bacterium]MBK7830756.1 TonB-dependent receptor [Gemmatimonadota bacterium]
MRLPAGFFLLALALSPVNARVLAQTARDSTTDADSARARSLRPIRVLGRVDELRGFASTASQGHVGSADLRLRPLMREGELLESVPGLIVTQHSGDGKSNQLFVRGFNLDHGTDFSTKVEGMPVNMASHAHGQGYTDLNFIIPELVDFIDYRLGNYHTAIGDFGSAGGAEFQFRRTLDRPFLSVGAGEFGYTRAAGGASLDLGRGSLLMGGEAKRYDGPWQVEERLRKFSGLARYATTRGQSRFSLLGMAYRNTWDSSDQVPMRAVRDATIARFGQVDPSLGGESSRYSLSAQWDRAGARSVQQVQLYGIASRLDLYSNFTYFLDDEDSGDQFNQREGRATLGLNATHKQPFTVNGVEHLVTLGVQHRSDLVDDIGLHRTRDRVRTGTIRQDDVTERGTGLYVEVESRWRPRLRTVLGVRGDAYTFDVRSVLAANSGTRSASIASPKASLIFVPSRNSELYVSGGFGFHSNDARGTVITVDPVSGDAAERVNPLVRSTGAEFGLRVSPTRQWRSTVALWALRLDSELLFVGDGGTTEPTDGSGRCGITFANFFRPIAQLSLDADVSFARARLRDVAADADHIPGALERVVAAGITWSGAADGPFASLRLRHFGAYPLIEDNSVRATATTLVNAASGLTVGGVRVQLSILNLLGTRASDIQYYYASRLRGEPAGGVDDVHFHPVEPRQIRLALVRGL